MTYEEAEKYVKSKIGLRLKKDDGGGYTIYGNTKTIIIDLFKLIKLIFKR